MANIAVLGAGVVGLSTAVNIQERLPSAKVTIIADKFDSDTTSAGAGGIVSPRSSYALGIPEETLRRWCSRSFQYYGSVAHSAEAAQAGIVIIGGYELYDAPIPMDTLTFRDLVYDCRECTPKELQSLPVKYPYGLYYRTVLVECRKYLPWQMAIFRRKGGRVVQRRIESLEELVGRFDLVVNCTGLGSRKLLGDLKVRANRGQAMRVDAPWVKCFYRVPDKNVVVFPCYDTVILGATKDPGDDSEEIRRSDTELIKKNTFALVPSLKDAPVLAEWVGLRPSRNPIRLESEIRKLPNGTLKMVHNYGHGGLGIGLGWGTAGDATDLVERMVRASKL